MDSLDMLTERACIALALAQQEAARLQRDDVGTEHLLLGLLREGNGVAAGVLTELGLGLEQARRDVAALAGCGDVPAHNEVNLTPLARSVLRLAVEEAWRRGQRHVDTEHLLLGLLRGGAGLAASLLEDRGLDAETVRRGVATRTGLATVA